VASKNERLRPFSLEQINWAVKYGTGKYKQDAKKVLAEHNQKEEEDRAIAEATGANNKILSSLSSGFGSLMDKLGEASASISARNQFEDMNDRYSEIAGLRESERALDASKKSSASGASIDPSEDEGQFAELPFAGGTRSNMDEGSAATPDIDSEISDIAIGSAGGRDPRARDMLLTDPQAQEAAYGSRDNTIIPSTLEDVNETELPMGLGSQDFQFAPGVDSIEGQVNAELLNLMGERKQQADNMRSLKEQQDAYGTDDYEYEVYQDPRRKGNDQVLRRRKDKEDESVKSYGLELTSNPEVTDFMRRAGVDESSHILDAPAKLKIALGMQAGKSDEEITAELRTWDSVPGTSDTSSNSSPPRKSKRQARQDKAKEFFNEDGTVKPTIFESADYQSSLESVIAKNSRYGSRDDLMELHDLRVIKKARVRQIEAGLSETKRQASESGMGPEALKANSEIQRSQMKELREVNEYLSVITPLQRFQDGYVDRMRREANLLEGGLGRE